MKHLLIFVILLTVSLPVNGDVVVVAYMGDSQVVLVESGTYKTLATLETGKNPHEVRVSPDHRHAYVAAGNTITAVDLRQRKVKANLDLGTYSAHDIRVPTRSASWISMRESRSPHSKQVRPPTASVGPTCNSV